MIPRAPENVYLMAKGIYIGKNYSLEVSNGRVSVLRGWETTLISFYREGRFMFLLFDIARGTLRKSLNFNWIFPFFPPLDSQS